MRGIPGAAAKARQTRSLVPRLRLGMPNGLLRCEWGRRQQCRRFLTLRRLAVIPRRMERKFFNPQADITAGVNRLPHGEQPGAAYFPALCPIARISFFR